MDPIVEIIEYINRTKYEDLPGELVERVKKAVVDTVGAIIAGSSAPLGKLVAEMVKEFGGKMESSLLVYGDKLPALEAAFANAIMARCRELDDIHEGNKRLGGGHGGHVNVMIVPAALAILESMPTPVNGKTLITAIAIGGDIIVRLRAAAGEAGRVGWEAPTIAPFGVAASVAKLLGLGEEVMANAMGAAYAQCAGNVLSTSDGTWDVWLNAGTGVRGGLMAVELARRGHIGAKSPLLGGAGLYPLYFRNEYLEDTLLSDLGKEFESANVCIKPYSSCSCTHHAIYTTLELVKKHNIKADQVERIAVRTCSYHMWLVAKGEHKYAPRNLNEAQFSMPFTMATAIIKGGVFPDVLNEETIKDAEILKLTRKITVEATPEKDEFMKKEGYPPDDVDIYTTDGNVYSGSEPFVIGHPQNPMTFEDVVEKFERCVKLSAKPLHRRKLDEFLTKVKRLEQVDDVRALITGLNDR
ncbi:MAG: MmgE/PrpD family protein [Armatimonadota bacterium]|nr:MmgE/PrpD family protein [Armatimonadota bacterium]